MSVGEGEDRVILDGANGAIKAGESRISPSGSQLKMDLSTLVEDHFLSTRMETWLQKEHLFVDSLI